MIWLLYNIALIGLAPIWVPWMLWRASKRKDKPNWKERAGEYVIPRRIDRQRIWLHAVSVGEVFAARPIITELKTRLPDHEIVLTCTTSTGRSVAEPMVGKQVDYLFYLPIDIPRFCMAAMTRVEPAVVVIMETELWLNFLWAAKLTNAKTCLANGRISEKSFRGASKIAFFYREIFSKLDLCLMQTLSDRIRASELGASETKDLGNSKYDEAVEIVNANWRAKLAVSPTEKLIVVGSARGEEEEDLIIAALKGLDARVVFAPRHVERGDGVQAKATAAGFKTGLRSKGENEADFLVLDTFGELAFIYPEADIAIIGGGFADLGGQNIIQPMASGCPVICGPHMKNFREPFESGLERGALKVASTAEELRAAIDLLLNDEGLRKSMSEAGKKLVAENLGASSRYASEIVKLAEAFHASRTQNR
ncbi:MAG: 3-deoxy-D-manno-octulosonic acid transferase [Fimbriimonadales bacterium]